MSKDVRLSPIYTVKVGNRGRGNHAVEKVCCLLNVIIRNGISCLDCTVVTQIKQSDWVLKKRDPGSQDPNILHV